MYGLHLPRPRPGHCLQSTENRPRGTNVTELHPQTNHRPKRNESEEKRRNALAKNGTARRRKKRSAITTGLAPVLPVVSASTDADTTTTKAKTNRAAETNTVAAGARIGMTAVTKTVVEARAFARNPPHAVPLVNLLAAPPPYLRSTVSPPFPRTTRCRPNPLQAKARRKRKALTRTKRLVLVL